MTNLIPSNAELLDQIDAQLVATLAVAFFGPAEQGTAASARQACAAHVLLFRLKAARLAVAELRQAYETPVRPGPLESGSRLKAGGPVKPPGCETGEEPTPGSAAAVAAAARESTGVVAGAGAAFPSGKDRAGALPRSGAVSEPFVLPVPEVPPWVVSRRRLAELGVGPQYDALPGRP